MAAATISLPQASVNKVINLKLQPGGLHMSKDAKEAISQAASVFVLYLASTCVAGACRCFRWCVGTGWPTSLPSFPPNPAGRKRCARTPSGQP